MTIMQDVGPVYALISKFECERLGEDYLEGGLLVKLKVGPGSLGPRNVVAC